MAYKQLTLRQRKILNFLQNHGGYITSSEISLHVGVSSKTVRTDIREINRLLDGSGVKIVSENSKGCYLSPGSQEILAGLERAERPLLTREDRVRFLAMRLCLSEEPLDMYELEDEMYVSRTTLEHDLAQLKREYTVRVRQSRDMIVLREDEAGLRRLLNQLFFRDWDYKHCRNAYYGHGFLDKSLLDWAMSAVSTRLTREKILIEEPVLVSLSLTVAIMCYRVGQGHLLPPSSQIPRTDIIADAVCRDVLGALEEKTGIPLPIQEQDAVYTAMSAGRMRDMSVLNFQTMQSFFKPQILTFAKEYLELLSARCGIELSGDEDFYITLLHYLSYLSAPDQPFNEQENRGFVIVNLVAEYELANLIQPLALRYLGRELIPTQLLYLAVCLSGAVEYSRVLHPERKIQAVICSQLNMPMVWAIKRKVLSAFGYHIDIEALLPVNARESYDFSDTDLILSTITGKLTEEPGVETLNISPFLSHEDYQAISSFITLRNLRKMRPEGLPPLHRLLEEGFWHEDEEPCGEEELIRLLADDFLSQGLVEPDYLSDILHRSVTSKFFERPGVLFLYSFAPAKRTCLSTVLFRRRALWGSGKIRFAVMACFAPEDSNYVFELMYTIYVLRHNEEALRNLRSKEDIINYYRT